MSSARRASFFIDEEQEVSSSSIDENLTDKKKNDPEKNDEVRKENLNRSNKTTNENIAAWFDQIPPENFPNLIERSSTVPVTLFESLIVQERRNSTASTLCDPAITGGFSEVEWSQTAPGRNEKIRSSFDQTEEESSKDPELLFFPLAESGDWESEKNNFQTKIDSPNSPSQREKQELWKNSRTANPIFQRENSSPRPLISQIYRKFPSRVTNESSGSKGNSSSIFTSDHVDMTISDIDGISGIESSNVQSASSVMTEENFHFIPRPNRLFDSINHPVGQKNPLLNASENESHSTSSDNDGLDQSNHKSKRTSNNRNKNKQKEPRLDLLEKLNAMLEKKPVFCAHWSKTSSKSRKANKTNFLQVCFESFSLQLDLTITGVCRIV